MSMDKNGKSDSYVLNKATGQKLDVDIVDDNFQMEMWVTRAKPVAEVKKEKDGVNEYNGRRFKAIEPEEDEEDEDEGATDDEENVVNSVFIRQV